MILVFEDLQWADSGLLDFVDYLLEWSAEHPIFILALGRPELEPRRPGWGTAIRLDVLPPSAMHALLDGLGPGPRRATSHARILERAEGVPLYAVETVRMLLDRGVLAQQGNRYVVTSPISDLDVPETLQALVAARLDNLDASERRLLQDAAVLGISFFPAAVAAVSERPDAEVRRMLDALVDKQVLGREDDQRSGEQGQYHFLQALLRTIALGTLVASRPQGAPPRRRRAPGSRRTATRPRLPRSSRVTTSTRWRPSPTRLDADADSRAGPRDARPPATAPCRWRSVPRPDATSSVPPRSPDDEPERAELLAEAGYAAARTADREGARALLGDAVTALDAAGRDQEAGRTRMRLASVLIADNRLEQAGELLDEAQHALSDPPALAEIAARRAQVAFLTDDFDRAREQAELALSIADPRVIWGRWSPKPR